MLADADRQAPHAVAITDGRHSINYQQYASAAAGLATHLLELGLAGRRVAVMLGNSVDMCIAMFAVHAARAQAVPLNPLYSSAEVTNILKDCEASCVVCDAEAETRVGSDLSSSGLPVVSTTEFDLGFRNWMDKRHPLPTPFPEADQVGSVQYTGGTTGMPKGVELTHGAIAVNISQREALLPTQPQEERLLCVAPLFHVYAMSMGLHNMCYCRSTLVLLRRFDSSQLLTALAQLGITLLAGNPTLFSGLMRDDKFATTDFSKLKLSYSGAAPLSLETLTRWESITGSPVLEGYGLSEAGPVVSFNPIHGLRKPGSVGLAVPDTQLRIEPNGEIRVRGPQLMKGYLNNPEETSAALVDGWLHTGDLGALDEDGYLFIKGRLKDMLKVSGFSVFPREIEEVLHQHEQIVEAAVVGLADSHKGEVPVAFFVAKVPFDQDVLLEHCRARLASYKIPARFHCLDALPKTGPGKVDKQLLTRQAQEFS